MQVKPRAIALWYEHQKLLSERTTLLTQIEDLKRQLQQKNKRLFGPSSERSKKTGADAKETVDAKGTETKEQTGHPRRVHPDLEVDRRKRDLPASERVCDVCQGVLDAWEGEFETSRSIDIENKRYVVRQDLLQKYRCRCGGCIKTAPAPDKLKEGGAYSIGFGVDVAVEKYGDGKSLERQVKAMGRSGLVVDSQTLWDQVDSVAFWGLGAYRAVKDFVLSHMTVGADETTWRLMENHAGKTGSERWWIWIARVASAVFYTFEDSRSADAGGKLFDGFEGVIMCDGCGVYPSLAKRNTTFVLAHCWSHIRRSYQECSSSFPRETTSMLALIDELFALERSVKDADLSTRLSVRKEKSVPVLGKIAKLAFELGLSHSTQSRLYVVTKTMSQQWAGLTLFVRDARIPLHNNATEQSARAPVQGRRAHQGSRSERGTQVAAILYTLVETAKLSGVEPRAYLHLSMLRAIRGQPPVLPHEVTVAMLMETLSLSESLARASVRTRAAPPEAKSAAS